MSNTVNNKVTVSGSLSAFLASIDVGLDAETPARIQHFMPTEKSIRLVQSLMGEDKGRASIFVAPYGSGKSIAALYALNLIENRPESDKVLEDIESRLGSIDPRFASAATQRRKNCNAKGLVVPLSGPQEALHRAIFKGIREAIRRFGDMRIAGSLNREVVASPDDLIPFLKKAEEKVSILGFDRIVFVWDEFGKHLEYLVQGGKTAELFLVQRLAEYIVRAELPMSLGLFMHMGFLHYAGTLSQSARNEWKKIEGRFQTIDYVDDSDQVYSLIGRLVEVKRKEGSPKSALVDNWVKVCRDHRLFHALNDLELKALVESSYPFTPPALFLLPRIAARIAQNERTLFHFIEAWDGVSEVRPEHLFDYFSTLMRNDISTGGTHRQWLEANSALQKLENNCEQSSAIKSACLFGLGLHGREGGASHKFIQLAWQGFNFKTPNKANPVDELISKKLLLYRPYKDEVSVWHGTDVDLRGHLEAEKSKRGASFDLIGFLNEKTPPPTWRPVQYNSEFAIRRFFSGTFHTVPEFIGAFESNSLEELVRGDGHVFYLLPDTKEEASAAVAYAKRAAQRLFVVATPNEPLPLTRAALEVDCLYRMQQDQDLIASDPLTLEEIRQLTADAEAHLEALVARATAPEEGGPHWFFGGKQVAIRTIDNLRASLSELCKKQFSDTPRLNNELINKKAPTQVVVNARKKCVMGILERVGEPDLGLKSTTPDGSMFRTLLRNTGLYGEIHAGKFGFRGPQDSQITDKALAGIWDTLKEFFSEQSSQPRDLQQLRSRLLTPPIGLREGVLPILLAAGIRSFGGNTVIRRDGQLLEDLLPSTVEEMCEFPEAFEFEALNLPQKTQDILLDFVEVFGGDEEAVSASSLVESCSLIIIEWRGQLPYCAKSRSFEEDATNEFKDHVYNETDTMNFFLTLLPGILKKHKIRKSERKKTFLQWKVSLETAHKAYVLEISSAIRKALDLKNSGALIESARSYAEMFDNEFINQLPDPKASAFLRRLRMKHKDEEGLCKSIAQLLVEKRLVEFDDYLMDDFRSRLKKVTEEIDQAATWVESSLFGDSMRSWLVRLRQNKINELVNDLDRLLGTEKAMAYLSKQMEKIGKTAN